MNSYKYIQIVEHYLDMIGIKYKEVFDDYTVDLLVEDKYYFSCISEESQLLPNINHYRDKKVIVITNHTIGDLYIPKANGVKDGSNGLKYLHKCPNPLIGVDISLFVNPPFPFSEDRPQCFYKVRVDGNRSPLEAWEDKLLRWKMIVNRIEYAGGFINSKDILNAMNITRTCKQPSWFSKNFAKKIIQEYITTDIIFDPFAGWGARCDACKELGKTYYGFDFNKELVDWHHEKGRTMNTGCGIEWGDANYIKSDINNCSVFICPPYSDPKTGRCFEDYNFNGFNQAAKSLSQCDWLKIVMKNIPNAKEYVMVCKVVDKGFESFIIDTKSNRSHFGTNNEYILSINNKQSKELI